jgi:hypothetical protein
VPGCSGGCVTCKRLQPTGMFAKVSATCKDSLCAVVCEKVCDVQWECLLACVREGVCGVEGGI